jgi:hypothetical protein
MSLTTLELGMISLLATLYSCGVSEDSNNGTSRDESLISYVMVNSKQCDLIGDVRLTEVSDLSGVWVDTLHWLTKPDDTCFYGAKSLDRHIELTFNPSKTFVWRETYSNPDLDHVSTGEYFLWNEVGHTQLTIGYNAEPDTLLAENDTIQGHEFRVYWTPHGSMLLLGRPTGVMHNVYVFEFTKLN